MKKLTVLALVLALCLAMAACGCKHEWLAATCDNPKTCELCGETEGEAKGHSIVIATCQEAEHCENCNYVHGEPLGHTWVDATTEAPKTCETCGATEGERIITDPRFTTASTVDLHGKWMMEIPFDGEMMGIPGFPSGAAMYVTMVFGNAGELTVENTVSENFADMLIQFTVDTMYAEFANQGMDVAAVDAMFESTYGMSVVDYVNQTMSGADMDDVFSAILGAANLDGVYYVEGDQIYTGNSWDEELTPESFNLEGDTLTMGSFTEVFGDVGAFQRIAE